MYRSFFKEQALILKPFGDLFINLIFTVTVPLVFFTISSAIANMNHPKRLGKVMIIMIITFIITSIIAIFIGIISTYIAKPLNEDDIEIIRQNNYAPIGLGCYFATVIAQLGSSIVSGYLRCFIIYTLIAILYYFIIYTLYAFISGGKDGIKIFWKNVLPPTITALATCSSAATIPFGIKAAKNMGVSDDIAETVVPLGVNIHKNGSLIGAVMKIAFLVAIFGGNISIGSIIGGSLVVGLLMGSVPGAGLVSEMMILTIFGFPAEAIGIIAIIGTLIDCPGAVLNGVGNISCSMLVGRFVDGKDWIRRND